MPSVRGPGGRFLPQVRSVADVPRLIASGVITRAYGQRIAGKAQRAGFTELTPTTRKVARGHEETPREKRERIAQIAAQRQQRERDTPVRPDTTKPLARAMQNQDAEFRKIYDRTQRRPPRDVLDELKGDDGKYSGSRGVFYTPADSGFGRIAYYDRRAMADLLRYMGYASAGIDYILYPEEE